MNYPFDAAGLTSEQIDLYQETYDTLKSKFRLEVTGDIDFHLPDFEVFRGNTEVNLKGSFVIKNSRTDCYVLFVEVYDVRSHGNKYPKTSGYYEYHTWALAYLKKDFGRVLIRPETLVDKLIELVHPVELDFEEDKAFSDTWYVLTNDRWKAEAAMNRDFRNVVMDVRHDHVVIEIIDHTLIIGHNRPASPDASLQLAEFVVRLCSNC
ncbi:MAG TPA: hypothetical protein VG367_05340 [Mucilaginibacter sp.]|jgi:hypothetical protein|nr:hypothetical protein [Mucilaginibacter sp.]